MPEVMFDYSKLKGRIIEKFGTADKFAEAYGVSSTTVSRWFNNKAKISTRHMKNMSRPDVLDIPEKKWKDYFFTLKVQETRTRRE